MTNAKTVKDNIVQLFSESDEVLPETPLMIAPAAPWDPVSATGLTAVDLTGKPRIIMTFGAGRSGKSTLLRWCVERAQRTRSDEGLVLATADARRPTLKRFFPGAMMPGTPDGAMAWLEKLLSKLVETRKTAAIDFGADMSLVPLLAQLPNLHQVISDAGVEAVALYLLTPRSGDLTVLDGMEKVGFRPVATALILNMGTMMQADAEAEFAQIRRHSAYKAAIERGAVEIWMPRLWAARAVEDRGISFHVATEAESGIALFDRSRVFHWLNQMDQAFAPIGSWLP